jgi:cytochrome c-type biogenesis protein CcmI
VPATPLVARERWKRNTRVGLVVGAALLTVGVMLFLVIPILRGERASFERTDEEPTEIGARKHVALKGLRDAEYDYRSGKLDKDDYRQLKAEMSRDALEAMEDEKAQVRQSQHSDRTPSGHDFLEEQISRARRGLAEGRACLTCGHVNEEGSRFCAGCGRPLAVAASQPPSTGL